MCLCPAVKTKESGSKIFGRKTSSRSELFFTSATSSVAVFQQIAEPNETDVSKCNCVLQMHTACTHFFFHPLPHSLFLCPLSPWSDPVLKSKNPPWPTHVHISGGFKRHAYKSGLLLEIIHSVPSYQWALEMKQWWPFGHKVCAHVCTCMYACILMYTHIA